MLTKITKETKKNMAHACDGQADPRQYGGEPKVRMSASMLSKTRYLYLIGFELASSRQRTVHYNFLDTDPFQDSPEAHRSMVSTEVETLSKLALELMNGVYAMPESV